MSDAVSFSNYPANTAEFFDMITSMDDSAVPSLDQTDVVKPVTDVDVSTKDVTSFNADMTRFNGASNETVKLSIFYCLLDYFVNPFTEKTLDDLAIILVSNRLDAEAELADDWFPSEKFSESVKAYAARYFNLTSVRCKTCSDDSSKRCLVGKITMLEDEKLYVSMALQASRHYSIDYPGNKLFPFVPSTKNIGMCLTDNVSYSSVAAM